MLSSDSITVGVIFDYIVERVNSYGLKRDRLLKFDELMSHQHANYVKITNLETTLKEEMYRLRYIWRINVHEFNVTFTIVKHVVVGNRVVRPDEPMPQAVFNNGLRFKTIGYDDPEALEKIEQCIATLAKYNT